MRGQFVRNEHQSQRKWQKNKNGILFIESTLEDIEWANHLIKEKEISKRQDLLIIDYFGLLPIDSANRSALMEIVEDRHNRASMIITSQLPVNCWHEVIGEKTVADAILDRIVHDAHRIELRGESLRKTREKQKNLEIMN